MFKICPDCRGEFQAWVTRCPDCGVALQLEGTPLPDEMPRELPPAHELECVERGDPRALHLLAVQFQDAGLDCRIDPYPPDQPIRLGGQRGTGVATTFGLYVRPPDADRARRLLTEHVQRTLPEAAGLEVAPGAELLACPACGTPLAEGAHACAECGLEFPEAGEEP